MAKQFSLYDEIQSTLTKRIEENVTADNPLSLAECITDMMMLTAEFIVSVAEPEDHESLATFAHEELDRWLRHEQAS